MEDFNTTVRTFTEGLRDLPTDDIARVQHFLAEYLGDSRHPVPFGGRERDFERLDAWLADRQAPPYLLLAAPAGRGKSALLLRWCRRLFSLPGLAVVYFPVSIRFRTNLAGVVFPSLVALLARLHGESIPGDPHTHEEVWRGLFREYLTRPLPDGRRLLLVLDGIDEAADWAAGPDLLPPDPPADLRVVLSARFLANDEDAGSWLKRLGWSRPGLASTLELYPLDRVGIASVLFQMGFPVELLSTRVDIVSELHRLSEGDPLLVRLYVDDLWERGEAVVRLQPEDLHVIRPGLTGYFERWWNDQRQLWSDAAPGREAAVQSILNVLAGALGPLSKSDILHLAADESGLDGENLERHLQPLARFVIGDGMHQGYVFSHPRLAGYFLEERLSSQERQEVERRFLAWGERTLRALNDRHLPPEGASPYIVQYYGAHLERAQARTNAFLALVSDGWRRAWEKLDRAQAGFLGDSERAWRAAEREDEAAVASGQVPPYLGAEIRSLLCRTSINSMTGNISPRLMLEAVKTGVWTPAQGLASIRLITDLVPRARELVGLAPFVQEPLRSDILQEALDTIMALQDERARLDALVELASGLSASLLAQILENVPIIEDEADRAGMLADLARALAPHLTLIEQALAIAQAMEEEEYEALALSGLAPYLSALQAESVLHLARTMRDERYRAQTLMALLSRLPAHLLPEVAQEASRLWDTLSQARLLAELVRHLPEQARAETMQETLKLLGEIVDQEYRVELLVGLAPYLPEKLLVQTLQEVEALWDEGQRARALGSLLPCWPENHLESFLRAVLAIKHEEQRVSILLQVLPHLPEKLLEQVLETVQTIWDEGRRAELLARLAPLATEAMLPRLLELIQAIEDPGYRVWLLAELETFLSGKVDTLPFDIVHTFRSMKGLEERSQTLLAIVPRLSDQARARIFNFMLPEVFNFRWATQSADRQAQILSKLGGYLPEAWLSRAVSLARTITGELYQAQVLIALAPRLPHSLLPEVLDIVRAMREREQRARVLEVLVSLLPEESKGERVGEMLHILQVIKDENERAHLASEFLRILTADFPAQRVPEVLKATGAMRSETLRAQILTALAAHTPEESLHALLQSIQQLRGEEERAQVLTALAERIPEPYLSDFLTAVQTIQHKKWRTQALAKVAAHVSSLGFAVLLDLVYREKWDEDELAQILSQLAAHTPRGSFPQLWHAIQKIKTPRWRAWVLGSLTLRVPEEYFPELWETIQAVEDEGWQLRTIGALAPHMSERFFVTLWGAIQNLADERRLRTIGVLAPYVPERFFPQVFQVALATFDEKLREGKWRGMLGDALEALATHVPESFFLHFWQAVRTMPDAWRRERLQFLLAARVPERLFAQVWQAVEEMENQWQQARLLEVLAPRVPERFFDVFWQTLSDLKYRTKQMQILKILLPHLSVEYLATILNAVQTWPYPHERGELLESLLPYLSAEQSASLLHTLLAPRQEKPYISGRESRPDSEQLKLLVGLAPRLPESEFRTLLPELLQAARRQPQESERVRILTALAPRIPEESLPEVVDVLWSLEGEREGVLAALLPALTPAGWSKILELATAKMRAGGDVHVLGQILQGASTLAHTPGTSTLYPALRDLLHLLAQSTRRDTLAHLMPLATTLRALGGEKAVIETCCAALETGYWWP
jgi:hypothetical protein